MPEKQGVNESRLKKVCNVISERGREKRREKEGREEGEREEGREGRRERERERATVFGNVHLKFVVIDCVSLVNTL